MRTADRGEPTSAALQFVDWACACPRLSWQAACWRQRQLTRCILTQRQYTIHRAQAHVFEDGMRVRAGGLLHPNKPSYSQAPQRHPYGLGGYRSFIDTTTHWNTPVIDYDLRFCIQLILPLRRVTGSIRLLCSSQLKFCGSS